MGITGRTLDLLKVPITAAHWAAEVDEAGPVPAVDGVVRWRRKDLARGVLDHPRRGDEERSDARLEGLGFANFGAARHTLCCRRRRLLIPPKNFQRPRKITGRDA